MFRRCLPTITAIALLVGCASTPELSDDDADPLESYNRAMFAFNDAVDKASSSRSPRCIGACCPSR